MRFSQHGGLRVVAVLTGWPTSKWQELELSGQLRPTSGTGIAFFPLILLVKAVTGPAQIQRGGDTDSTF